MLGRILPSSCICLSIAMLASAPAGAWVDLSSIDTGRPDGARGNHVTDGSYVMNAGELQINITNFGLIGSQFTDLSTYYEAPSGQWPAGSGNEYLWGAGLWIGGIMRGQKLVSTGQYERELRPLDDPKDTIYEARDGELIRPAGNPLASGHRLPSADADDDRDGRLDEETLNGYDDDHDGAIDEDFGQLGRQMMVCTMYDNTRLSQEAYPDHVPLGLKVVQKSYAWDALQYRDFVGFEFQITNIGLEPISDVYIGIFVDCDIGSREGVDIAMDDAVGFYEGLVRASDNAFYNVNVGYMYDGAAENPLPGYFGVLFIGAGRSSPPRIRSFQHFSALRPFEFGGDPTDDAGRYAMLSADHHDPNTEPGHENDYRYLVSVGPWPLVDPGRTIRVYAAMVIGPGLDGMLKTCGNALSAWQGAYFDLDHNPETGIRGRETHLCFSTLPPPGSPIYSQSADFMDRSCVPDRVQGSTIQTWDFTEENGQYCIWVNLDNCQECSRLAGWYCDRNNHHFEDSWNCNQYWLPVQRRVGCTGIKGAEGQVPWIVDEIAPPPPGMRVVSGDHEVQIFWNDDSEYAIDPIMLVPDFESYRVMRADHWDRPFGSSLQNGPESDLWQVIAEFDLVDSYVVERTVPGQVLHDTLALGPNTGLDDIAYQPRCLLDPRFRGLDETMREVVAQDSSGQWRSLPPLRGLGEVPTPGLEPLLPWEAYRAVLDTFFMVTPRQADSLRGIVGKRAVQFYEYTDHDVHNGFLTFYSVVATDHTIRWADGPVTAGPGLAGVPGASFTSILPGTQATRPEDIAQHGTNIYVYPNPATLSSLAEFQQFHPNSDDPTGQRIMFANLPRCRNRISIYTLDGDLVQELWHDGTSGYGEVSWNLVNRNGQQIVAGIYLYAVEPQDSSFERFIGKFVVIK